MEWMEKEIKENVRKGQKHEFQMEWMEMQIKEMEEKGQTSPSHKHKNT